MKKETILQTAQEIILKSGLSHLLMDEVARRCGVSKKTIYGLFNNKDEMVTALTQDFLKKEREFFYNEMRANHSTGRKISFVIDYIFKMMDLIPYENLDYLKKRYAANHKHMMVFKEEVFIVFEELLRKAKENNEIYDDVHLHMHVQLLETQLNYIHENYRRFSTEGMIQTWKEQVISAFKRCMGPSLA